MPRQSHLWGVPYIGSIGSSQVSFNSGGQMRKQALSPTTTRSTSPFRRTKIRCKIRLTREVYMPLGSLFIIAGIIIVLCSRHKLKTLGTMLLAFVVWFCVTILLTLVLHPADP